MTEAFHVKGPDGVTRTLDEHYDTQKDVEQDPYGAWLAIQNQATRVAELEAKWQPIRTMPANEAVLIGGGDVLYPIVASKNTTNEGASYDLDAQGSIVRDEIAESPTHWMPLPNAPKGEQNKQKT